jgi:hypothetical protein
MSIVKEEDYRVHTTILGWLLIVGHAILLFIAAIVFVILFATGWAIDNTSVTYILTITGIVVGSCMTILSLPGILAGVGILKRKAWGRVLGIIVSILGLLNFPLGTLIGIYGLFVLFQDQAIVYFE